MYNDINEFFNEMNKAFEQAYKEVKNPIMVDVIKNDDSYQVLANLPGVKKEDIHISFDNKNLVVSVKQDTETKNEKKNYIFILLNPSKNLQHISLKIYIIVIITRKEKKNGRRKQESFEKTRFLNT